MDLITVIVPAYMTEQYLDRCIASICQQTYANLEIILIDDGSSDCSPEICNKWGEMNRRIKVIHQKNQGVSAARNVGVKESHGNYIMMVDSDDYLYAGMIETMYITQKKYEVDLVICDFIKGNSENFEFPNIMDSQVELISAETALRRIYESDEKALQYVAPWAKLYKKELFEEISYPEGKIFEDIYITHKILYKCKKIAVISRKMLYYFQHSESIMNREFHVGKLDYLEALKERIYFFHNHEMRELETIAYDEYLHSLIWEYSRTRDLLNNKAAMREIVERYREIYVKGYSSKRYRDENVLFLWGFFLNPELIIWYWKVKSKLKKVC